jgi:Do/DeqQ family serine protease
MKAHRSILAAVAAFGLVGAGAALKSGTQTVSAAPAGIPTDGTVADVAEKLVDSVVTISVKHEEAASPQMDMFGDPFDVMGGGMGGGSRVQEGKGSGVIVTASGRILTNAHVVNGFEDIKVTLPDGTEVDAKVVGKDTKGDLAVLQLKGQFPPLKPVTFGDSSSLRLGDIVLAIGDGMGVGKSVSMGIVSAKSRGNVGIEEYEDFIQTDATINPGNSGGALVNLKGELVGINTAIASRSGGSQGIGFAIPSNMARPIMEQLVQNGKVSRGYLGVNIGTVTPAIAKEHKLGTQQGVEVGGVQQGGPAASAHLAEGDVIIALDGKGVRDGSVLRNSIAMTRPGTTVALDIVHRDGSKGQVKVKLGELPEETPVAQQNLPNGFKTPPGWSCQQTPQGIQCEKTQRRSR